MAKPTTYVRTPEQREAARQRMAAYHAQKKASASSVGVTPGGAAPVGGQVVPPGGESTLNVTVKADTTPRPKTTLRERLGLGGSKIATPTPVKKTPVKGKGSKPNLVVTVLPTILASLIATYARDRIPVEYQPCAPTKAEVQAIIDPLLDIIGRRVEVAAQVSQDAIDLTNSLICMMAYGARAYITYVDIRKAKEAGITHEPKQQDARAARLEQERRDYAEVESDPEATLARGLKAYQAQASGTDRNTVGVTSSGSGVPVNGATSNGAGNPADDRELRDYEAGLIANMFARDREGRVRLGNL